MRIFVLPDLQRLDDLDRITQGKDDDDDEKKEDEDEDGEEDNDNVEEEEEPDEYTKISDAIKNEKMVNKTFNIYNVDHVVCGLT
ncbi:hypothetical protein Tco_0715361, partial [Tanacetum coccineum]